MPVLRPVGPVLSAQVGASKASGGLGIVVGMSIGPERGRSRCSARAIHPYISHRPVLRRSGYPRLRGYADFALGCWNEPFRLEDGLIRAIPDREAQLQNAQARGNPQNATRYRASPELTTNHTKYTKRKTPMRKSFTALPFRAKEHSNTIPKALPWADGTGPTGRKIGIWKRKWSKNPCRITLLEV